MGFGRRAFEHDQLGTSRRWGLVKPQRHLRRNSLCAALFGTRCARPAARVAAAASAGGRPVPVAEARVRGGGTVTTSGEGGDVRCTHGARSKAAAAAPQRRGARRRRTSGCVETQRLAPRDLATPQRCGRRPLPPPLSQLARWDAAYLRLLGCCVRGSGPAAAGAQQCLNVDCREQRNRGYVAATVLVSVATAGCDLPSGKVLEEWLFEYKQCACDSNEMPSMVQAYNLMERVQALGHTTLQRRHHKLTG